MKRFTTKLLALLLALAMALSLAACGGGDSGDSGAAASQDASVSDSAAETDGAAEQGFTPYTFTDSVGHEIEINEELTAIVPSGPLAQVLLLTIAPDLFVGLGAKLSDDMSDYIADYDRLSQLTYFGSVLGADDLDVEALASTNADLVIDMGYLKEDLEEELAATEEMTGIQCVYIEAGLDTYADAYRMLGQLLGREERAEELAVWCETVYDRAMDIMEQVGDNKVDALYVLGEDGLNIMANGISQTEIFDLLVNNLAVLESPNTTGKGTTVNMEQIALWNPDFIVFGTGSIYSTVAENEAWSEITAIASGNYVECPDAPYNWAVVPPAVQRYLALLWLPTILYPEYVDYDLQEEVTACYELFWGVTLTDEAYASLTANAFPAQ